MQPSEYRKKPVTVQALRYDGSPDSRRAIIDWTRASSTPAYLDDDADGRSQLVVNTLEGTMVVAVGDYVIRGVKGEHYPCKPDVFAASYEPAEPKPIGWDDVTGEDVAAALVTAQAKEREVRGILIDLLNASHRGVYSAGFTRQAVARAEALLTPGMSDDEREAIAVAANRAQVESAQAGGAP